MKKVIQRIPRPSVLTLAHLCYIQAKSIYKEVAKGVYSKMNLSFSPVDNSGYTKPDAPSQIHIPCSMLLSANLK